MFGALISLLILILIFVGMYKTFAKMGYDDAWMLIIPFLNIVFMLKVADKPIWWIILFLIPVINILVALYVGWLVSEKVATAYGKGTGFAVGLLLLGFIFYPILGFGGGAPVKTA
ncbi:MAG: DUF5684 domain-containing protein [Planctomycetes bacterium]|nr:DUF5684 domain-containing protein [Planctomycetota bacterium]